MEVSVGWLAACAAANTEAIRLQFGCINIAGAEAVLKFDSA